MILNYFFLLKCKEPGTGGNEREGENRKKRSYLNEEGCWGTRSGWYNLKVTPTPRPPFNKFLTEEISCFSFLPTEVERGNEQSKLFDSGIVLV